MRGLSPSALTAVAGVTALVASFKGLTSTMKVALDNFSHFESMQKGLETFFQSADKGKAKFEELRKLSNETTFGVDELADSFTQLANVGVNVDTINDKLMMLGDISGGNKQKFAELVQIYAKIQSTGKAGAMQIQQLASRGVPIYDMLKKIGVQGTATGEDITKAFEKMTEEGGQFYNAMNNINDTIEGKEGFISDYFKEMTVNFAEVTGLADMYKKILDTLKEAIGIVSDKLGELNQNPIAKSIISGAFVGLLTTMATLIGITIVGAIKSVNARLRETVILKSILDPKTLGIALLVGGAVGLGIALKGVAKESENILEEQKAITNEMEKQVGITNYNDKLKKAEEDKKFYTEKLNALRLQTSELRKQLSDLKAIKQENNVNEEGFADIIVGSVSQEAFDVFGEGYKDTAKKINSANADVLTSISEIEEQITKNEKEMNGYLNLINNENETIGKLDPMKQRTEQYKKLSESASNYYNKTFGKDKLTELQAQYQEILDLKDMKGKDFITDDGKIGVITFDKDQQKEIDKTANYLKDKIENQKYKIEVDLQTDWQNTLQKAFGFTDKEVYNGATSSTVGAIDFYKKVSENQSDLMKSLLSNVDENYGKQEMYEGIISAFNTVMKSVRDGTYNGTEESLKAFAYEVDNAKEKLRELSLADMNKDYMAELQTNSLLGGGKEDRRSATKSVMSELSNKINDLLKNGISPMDEEVQNLVASYKNLKSSSQTMQEAFEEIAQSLKESDNIGEQIGGYAMSAVESASGDLSAFMQGFANGGSWGGIISTLMNALVKVAGSIEGFDDVMNPVTTAMYQLKPFIQWLVEKLAGYTHHIEAMFNVIGKLFDALEPLIDLVLNTLLEPINLTLTILGHLLNTIIPYLKQFILVVSAILKALTLGLVDNMKELNDSFAETRQNLDETNDKFTQGTEDLLKAMKEQEEWYIRNKTALNAETRKDAYSVNDMILTPNGTFSTHPNDTIIAMKHPEQLASQSVVLQPIINDYGGNEITVRQETDGEGKMQLFIDISKKIAQDVANGSNGWDSALNQRSSRLAGRRVNL